MRLASLAAFAAVAAVSTAAACSDETVVLATIPGTSGDGGTRSSDTRCVSTTDCPEGTFCDKFDCDDVSGVCEPYPTFCGDDEHTVCGCDGVNYYNDCLRRAAGVPHGRLSECSTEAISCGGPSNTPCPGTSICAKLGGYKPCSGSATGTCWVLPLTCPPPTGPDRFDECDPDGAHCVDACAAVRSGKSYKRAEAQHCG